MKRIAYQFENSGYTDILLKFCETDGFVAVELPADKEAEGSFVFFITDSKAQIERVFPCGIHKCFISSVERGNTRHYTMNKNMNTSSYRALLDEIYHGGRLWNMVDGVRFGASVRECFVSNSTSEVERFVCLITEDLIHCCTFSDLEKIRVGFSEMLTNAIEHGNLNITGKEKHTSTEDGTFQELLRARAIDPRYVDRKVYCKVSTFSDRVDILIRDEGLGFDVNKLPSSQDIEELMKLHGRGILIARAYFDEVKYNLTGNEVLITKRF